VGIGRENRSGNRRRRRVPDPVGEGTLDWTVEVAGEWSLLLHYPFIGPPTVVRRVPRSLGLTTWWDFVKTGHVELRAMKRPEQPGDRVDAWAACIDDILDRYPLVAEYLAATNYDGEPPGTRLPCSLLVFPQDGWWKTRLVDKNVGKCLWTTCSSLLDIWEALQLKLASPDPGWRLDRQAGHAQANREPKKKMS